MAEHLNGAGRRPQSKVASLASWTSLASLVLLALLSCATVHAENLADPTRPPAMLESAVEQDATPHTGPVLQSVLISPTRRIATIDGQAVKVGDKFGEARVARITENEVVLRNGRETQTLKLFPQMERQMAFGRNHPKAGSRQPSR